LTNLAIRFDKARSTEHHWLPEASMDGSGDARVCKSAQGISAVRCVSRVSNEIEVQFIDVDVSPEPAWADYSSPTHASLSVHLGNVGGKAETRLMRNVPAPYGARSISFTSPGAPIWGYSEGATRAAGVKLAFDLPRYPRC